MTKYRQLKDAISVTALVAFFLLLTAWFIYGGYMYYFAECNKINSGITKFNPAPSRCVGANHNTPEREAEE